MSGFSLCNSTSICTALPLSRSVCQKSGFFTYSPPCSLFSLCSLPQSRRTHLNFGAVLHKRVNRFCSLAVKKRRNGGSGLMEMNGSDDDDDDEGDDDWDGYEVLRDEGDDEGMILPLEEMNKWLENKPRGFGGEKVYDTSVEDKLLEEIEHSRQAQAANLNKLRNNSVKTQSKKDDKTEKALGSAQNGIRVRLVDLPKKKNIHRDLKSAFKGVPGVLNIIPVVSGNKKTKDPICKGFAFVDFKSHADATRFVESFSNQKISFGKVQKQINCQVMNLSSDESSHDEECSDDASDERKLVFSDSEECLDSDFVVEDGFSETLVDSDEPNYSVNEHDEVKMEDNRRKLPSVSTETPKESRQESETHLKPPKQLEKIQVLEKKFPAGGEKYVVHDSFQESEPWEYDDYLDDELDEVEINDIEENLEPAGVEELKDVGDTVTRPRKGTATELNSSEDQLLRIRALEKKLLARGKEWREGEFDKPDQKCDGDKKKREKKKKVLAKGQEKKGPKLEIPGSAKRLGIKEKAVLNGVLSKYAAKATLTNTKER